MFSNKSFPALGVEEEYGEKIDKCILNTSIKLGAGLVTGGIFSFLLFKRKAWPVTLGSGIGLGMAYRDCEKNLREHYIKKEEPILFVEKAESVQKVEVPYLFSEQPTTAPTENNADRVQDDAISEEANEQSEKESAV